MMGMILDLETHTAKMVTVEELAAYWNVSKKTIYRHIEKGALPVQRLPEGAIRIRIEDARRYGKPNQPGRD